MLEATRFHHNNPKFNKKSAVSKNLVPVIVSALPCRKTTTLPPHSPPKKPPKSQIFPFYEAEF